ncbi:MAG: glutaminase domain-containing protein, partial [Armatimonadota bacterium]
MDPLRAAQQSLARAGGEDGGIEKRAAEMIRLASAIIVLGAMSVTSQEVSSESRPFRPRAVPLAVVDPYFSVWSTADALTSDVTRHWTGAPMSFCGMARIDGKPYRFAGPVPTEVPPMHQNRLAVGPTRTVYTFEASGVLLTITFVTPLLLDNLDVMSRPVSYVLLDAASGDGHTHDVGLYVDVSAEWVVNTTDQAVRWNRNSFAGNKPLTVLRIGSQDQPVLQKSGDDLRTDWGYLYLVFPDAPGSRGLVTSADAARKAFAQTGALPETDDVRMPRRANDEMPVLACSMNLGAVRSTNQGRRLVTLVYDDLYSVEYFRQKLRAYWRWDGTEIEGLIVKAVEEFEALNGRCARFDQEILEDARKTGGEDYADIVALAYRQAVAAHKLVTASTEPHPERRAYEKFWPLLFSKECSSGGCMSTVDVSYPSSPMFLLFNTDLLRALLEPVFQYSASGKWLHDFAPHDVGLYPQANGQFYGGGPDNLDMQMPVEESANMLIMVCAMAHIDGDAKYARRYWDLLTRWADYLRARGLDPENQLCTDNFAGYLAHNTNLSISNRQTIRTLRGVCCWFILSPLLSA